MALRFTTVNLIPVYLVVLAIFAVTSSTETRPRHERHVSNDYQTTQRLRHSQSSEHPDPKPPNTVKNVLTTTPNRKISHRLVGGHVRMEAKTEAPKPSHRDVDDNSGNEDNDDDDEARWDDGLIVSSAGNGKEKTNNSKKDDDDEKKTLSQQVKEGKYGLIQNEIYPSKPKRPGIISYLSNPEVPKDNVKNLGGLDEDDIWLAENHVLVLRGGNFPDYETERHDNVEKSAWPPIDDYEAPSRQVKIPSRPKVPPPFPVRFTENGPLQIIGVNGTSFQRDHENSQSTKGYLPGEGPFFGTSKNFTSSQDLTSQENSTKKLNNDKDSTIQDRKVKSDDVEVPPGGLIGPFYPSLPPGAVFVLPPGNRTDYDEDDQSIYYPPPYSFYYKQDNSTPVPPGPLVPGIILPPPPDFFSRQEEKKPTTKVQYRKYTKRPTSTTPLPRVRPTFQPPRKPMTKFHKERITTTSTTTTSTPKSKPTPYHALYYFYEEAKDETTTTTRTTIATITKPTIRYRATTQKPFHDIQNDSPPQNDQSKNHYNVQPTTARTTSKNFETLEPTPKILNRYRYTNSPSNHRQSYYRLNVVTTTEKPNTFDEWKDYRDKIRNEKHYDYEETETQSEQIIQTERENQRYKNRSPVAYQSSTQRSLIDTTPNPQHAYYTKQDEQLLDDVTKEFFTNFGKKIRGESSPNTTPIYGKTSIEVTERPNYSEVESYDTNDYDNVGVTYKPGRIKVHYGDQTRRPFSLEDDTRVNYKNPLPSINPDAEWITDLNAKQRIPSRDDERIYYKNPLPPVEPAVEWIPELDSKQRITPQNNHEIYYKDSLPDVDPSNEWIEELKSKLRVNVPSQNDATIDYKETLTPVDPRNKWITSLSSKQRVNVPLDDDIQVNYQDPLPTVNPDSEWIPGFGPKQPINVQLQNYRNQQTQLQNQDYVQKNLTSQRLATIGDYARNRLNQQQNGPSTNYVNLENSQNDDVDDTTVNYPSRIVNLGHNINVNYPIRSKPISQNINANYRSRSKSLAHRINDDYPVGSLYLNDNANGNYPSRTVSLADDVNVNYRNPRPPINPNAEFIDPSTIRDNVNDKSLPYRSFAYRLPGDGGHFYFLTPHPINQPQDRNGGYLYPRPRGPRLSRRRKRGPDDV